MLIRESMKEENPSRPCHRAGLSNAADETTIDIASPQDCVEELLKMHGAIAVFQVVLSGLGMVHSSVD